jgi:hypothetical protein
MTRDEFEQARRRFGADIAAWPAPYRQQGLDFLALDLPDGERRADSTDDKALDRLVLESALMETDEQALARKVLARIDAPRRGPSFASWSRLSPAAMAAGIVAVLAAATAAGYSLAPDDGSLETDLLVFAVGAPDLADDGGTLPEDRLPEEDML